MGISTMAETSETSRDVQIFDPQAQPWAPIPRETRLPAELLTGDAIQARLDQLRPVPGSVLGGDSGLSLRALPAAMRQPVQAAVLMPIVMRGDGAGMLLTQRSANLSHHAGQISFPGGRAEHTDNGPVATALRESHEEIGLKPEQVRVLGALPQYLTVTGFAVTPIAAWVEGNPALTPAEREVAEIFEAPLEYLLDPANYRIHSAQLPDGANRSYYSVSWDKYFIWGATAAMLRNLYLALRPGT